MQNKEINGHITLSSPGHCALSLNTGGLDEYYCLSSDIAIGYVQVIQTLASRR